MDLGQEAEALEEGKGRPSVISLRYACKQQVLDKCSMRVGWMEKEAGGGSSSSVNGMTSSPSSGRLNATENTHHLGGGWTTRGLRVFRLGKMKDTSVRELQPGWQTEVSGLFGSLSRAAHAPLPLQGRW